MSSLLPTAPTTQEAVQPPAEQQSNAMRIACGLTGLAMFGVSGQALWS